MDMKKMMQQVQQMQSQVEQLQSEAANQEVTGSAGGNLVEFTMNGKGEAKKLKIDNSLISIDEKDVLEDLVVAAVNDARQKVEQQMGEAMAKVTGGLNLPGGFGV